MSYSTRGLRENEQSKLLKYAISYAIYIPLENISPLTENKAFINLNFHKN